MWGGGGGKRGEGGGGGETHQVYLWLHLRTMKLSDEERRTPSCPDRFIFLMIYTQDNTSIDCPPLHCGLCMHLCFSEVLVDGTLAVNGA